MARLIRCDEPGYGEEAAALGLALADPLSEEPRINLARTQALADDPRRLPLEGARPPRRDPRRRLARPARHGLRCRSPASRGGRRARRVPVGRGDGSGEARRREEGPRGADQGDRVVSRHAGGLVRPDAHHRAAAPPDTVITSLSGDAEVESGALRGTGQDQEAVGHQLRDAPGRRRLVAPRDRRIPRLDAGRSLAQAALPAHRGHRPTRQSGPAGRTPVGIVQRRLPTQGREGADSRLEADARTRCRPVVVPIANARATSTHEPDPSDIRTRPGDREAAQQPPEAPARALFRDDRGVASSLLQPARRHGLRHDGTDRRANVAAPPRHARSSSSRSPWRRTASSSGPATTSTS